ncbi:hypothetical protein HB815_16330 [Listeria booriae]|uniref:leucine-rich repeat domain-containing protein n=1 Tax=Listeria booriae TaxID=1552123 RepID=UPI0016295806|nr:leucine-rich repeat domain-containing protein [Listeria booriae]MBC1212494.1 hypothetical protein [Listeria booriae]
MNKTIQKWMVGLMLLLIPVQLLSEINVQAAAVEKEYKIEDLFPDPILAENIALVFKKEKGDYITKTQLSKVGSLVIKNQKVMDLAGIETLINMTGIQLTNTSISNLKPLENLTALKNVTLTYNKITDISPLNKLVNTKNLQLQGNAISDVSVLANLVNLTNINLYNNNINDISGLAKLDKITTLDLGLNHIKSVDALANLKNLKSLQLNSNLVEDIAPLQNLPVLTVLGLHFNNISNITPAGKIETLMSLDFSQNRISEINSLKTLQQLTYLKANNNQLIDAKVVEYLSNLTYLNLEENQLRDVTPLKNLADLQELNISFNRISDISPLKSLPNLSRFLAINQKIEASVGFLGEATSFILSDRESYVPTLQASSDYQIYDDKLIWKEVGTNKLSWQNKQGDFSGQLVQDIRGVKQLFLDDFMLGDKYITGVYSSPDIVKMSVQVNQKDYYGGDVVNNKLRFYIEGKIMKVADEVLVKAYNKKGDLVEEQRVNISTIPKDHAKWDNTKVLFIGDSITSGLRANISYPSIVAKKLRLPMIQNEGISGALIAQNNGSVPSLSDRLDMLDISQMTHVVIFGGTNDFQFNTPMGNITSIDKRTFYGALNAMASQLKAQHKKMYFVTPMWRSRQVAGDNKNSDSYTNDLGLYLDDYGDAINEIALRYNAPCLDLYAQKPIYQNWLPDGVHPNDAGQYFIGEKVASMLNN